LPEADVVGKKNDNIKKTVETDVAGPLEPHGSTDVIAVDEDLLSKKSDLDDSKESAFDKVLKESEENRDRWLRSVAELENFKKRSLQERSKLLKYKDEDLLRELLPVVDNLERALSNSPKDDMENPLTQGVQMVLRMFAEALKKYGVTEIEALGKSFDPQFHEAIAQEPSANGPSNLVTRELEKGYMYKDRLLRPAKVIVSTAAKSN
jgi:molecular chaperone GrpE